MDAPSGTPRQSRALRKVFDDPGELVGSVAVEAGEVEEVLGASDDSTALRCAGDGDAVASSKLEQAFVAQHPQGAEHGVGVDAENGREVFAGRKAFSRLRLTLCDRATDLSSDLLVEVGAVGSIDIDIQYGASNSSVTVSGVQA